MSRRAGPAIREYEVISPLEMPEWDGEIRRYGSKCLFHESAWLRFLRRSQPVSVHGLRLFDEDGEGAGYFCGALARKGFFRLLGSPLQGWTTAFMGPVTNGLDAEGFLRVLEEYARALRAHYIEVANPVLPGPAMRAAGYELDADTDLVVTIDAEPSMWSRVDGGARRYCLPRAARRGLSVERAADPAFVHEYHAQLRDVFRRQGLVPTYGRDRVQALWDTLMPTGNLLALRVRHGDDVIATGLFPFDERAIYFWGGASWVGAYPLHPNEFLHWHAMLFALERGIPEYHMGGGGAFKRKFGGTEAALERWFKPLTPLAAIGREAFRRLVRARQRALGTLDRLSGRDGRAGR